jgi:hypothetical protein
MNSIEVNDKRKPSFLWIDSSILWDMQLNPYEGWAYNRFVYRAGGNSSCFEAKGRMAKACGMSLTTFKKAVKGLVAKNMIVEVGQVTHSNGATTHQYTLTDSSEWVKPPSDKGSRDAPMGRNTPRQETPTGVVVTRLDPQAGDAYKQNLDKQDLNKPDLYICKNGNEVEDAKGGQSLDSTLNTPTCPGPAAKSKSVRVQPRGKKKTRIAKEIYDAMESFDDFMTFWKWYKDDVTSLPGVSHDGGNRAEAGEVWLKLESNNFFGLGKDAFWQAIALQLEKIKSKKNSKGEVIGILHACRFLGGGEKGEPDWLVTYEESQQTTTRDTSMIVANVETSSLESIRQQILAILSELNMTAALPQQVRDATGCKILSELDQSQCVRYLNMLKRIKEKKQNQEGTAA